MNDHAIGQLATLAVDTVSTHAYLDAAIFS